MLARIIFCSAVSLATIAVIVLAVVTPVSEKKNHSKAWLDLSLYIQQPQISTTTSNNVGKEDGAAALVFRRVLTEGPEKSSRVVGRAEGFVIPTEQFAFDVIYLSFDGPHHSGSLSVQAHKDKDEFKVIGGTGSFAFARGVALFTKTHSLQTQLVSTYHVKLQLQFPNHSTNSPT